MQRSVLAEKTPTSRGLSFRQDILFQEILSSVFVEKSLPISWDLFNELFSIVNILALTF